MSDRRKRADDAARILVAGQVDLGDERAVIRALQKAGLSIGDFLDVIDDATALAKPDAKHAEGDSI